MTTPQSGWGFEIGHLLADVDMNSNQGKFVQAASTAGRFKLATGASGLILGVLQDDPRAGEPGRIRVLGTARVSASNAITYGTLIKSGSHGLAIAAGSGVGHGIALSALTSGGGYIEALLIPGAFTSAGS